MFQPLATDAEGHVVLGAGDPKDAPFSQPEEMLEVYVGFVEDGARTSDRSQLGRVVTQPVADIVQPDGVGKVAIQQAHHVIPSAEGAALALDPVLARELLD